MESTVSKCCVAKVQRTEMLAKLSKFCEDLLKHPEYHAIVFVLHDGAVSGFNGRFVRSRMFYDHDNSIPVEIDSSTVSASPVRSILCGIVRILEANHNGDNWWEDPHVTVCAFTSPETAKDALEDADRSKSQMFWTHEVVKPAES